MNIIQEIEAGLSSGMKVDVRPETIKAKLNEWRDGKRFTKAMQSFVEWHSAKSGSVNTVAFEVLENINTATKLVDAIIMEFKIECRDYTDDETLAFMMKLDKVNRYRSESMDGLSEHFRTQPLAESFFGGDEVWFINLAEDLPTYVGRSTDSLKEESNAFVLIHARSKSLRLIESV